ncbi:MAG: GH3 auxin-responsive promoter family protein [Bacteroidia bacterium]|nr:GH3 auxin-responsive promoter family protein [Bacteroidia bacterium]
MLGSVINWYFRQRHEDLLQLTSMADENQKNILEDLIENGRETAYGLKFGFRNIRNYADFRKMVPLVEYEDLKPWIEKVMQGEQMQLWPGEVTWFAKSSGTTSNSAKYIPISYESLEETHFKGGRDMVTLYCATNPDTKIFQGKALFIGGSYKPNELNPKTFSGDLSAVLWTHLPAWANMRSTPDQSIALMENWEQKLVPMITATLNENVTSITGVPTWVAVLFNKMLEITGKKNIHEIWPNLELFFHGGVNFEPYRKQFQEFLPGKMSYLETYNASEGFFGLQFQQDTHDFTLLTHHGIFYEFLPLSGTTQECIPLWETQPNIDYALVITTNSGLWRYKIGDTIRFSSTKPYQFKITGRTKSYINAFGEELVIENADTAILIACEKTGSSITDYTAGPVYMQTGNGGHEWLIEFYKAPENLAEFSSILDAELKKCNGDYAAKRLGDLAMHAPIVCQVPTGIFTAWLKNKGKLGVQNKIPRLSNNRDILEEITAMIQPGRAD